MIPVSRCIKCTTSKCRSDVSSCNVQIIAKKSQEWSARMARIMSVSNPYMEPLVSCWCSHTQDLLSLRTSCCSQIIKFGPIAESKTTICQGEGVLSGSSCQSQSATTPGKVSRTSTKAGIRRASGDTTTVAQIGDIAGIIRNQVCVKRPVGQKDRLRIGSRGHYAGDERCQNCKPFHIEARLNI